ncbi:hypothetical protein [Streptomyces sp. NPDC058667]|uniref:hypothetical protein n=1 Tax=Streptomyces sp. NPDC058667 TaxID=3346588 RepID=UPI003650FEAC
MPARCDNALAYPEPPASPVWHRHGPKPRPLTDAQRQRNRELLVLAQRTPCPAPFAPPRPWRRPADGHRALRRRRLGRRDTRPRPARHRHLRPGRPADLDSADEDAPDTVVTCTSGDPRIVHELLNGIQPGYLLRATGILVQPPAPGEPTGLVGDTLDVLDTALLPVLRDMVMDGYGDYCVIFDADRDRVPVFTALGQWVGLADNPDAIATLIVIHERANGGDV